MNANILPSQKKKIALISSQYLFLRSSLYLLFAQAYKKAGYDVVCINLLTDITHTQQQSQLFKNFKCYTILGKLHDTETPSTLNTNPRPMLITLLTLLK